jgi:two-component system OmpR family sensor kinase
MTGPEDGAGTAEGRLLATLERLLALDAISFEGAMQRAADAAAEVLGADKVDVFLHDAPAEMLVAVGASDTPMGRLERELGLDRLPVAGGGGTVRVFRIGAPYVVADARRDRGELRAIGEALGVRATMAAPLDVAGERRGVLLACSARVGFFSKRDLAFLGALARWVGLVGQRATLVEQIAGAAAEEGLRAAAEEAIGALTPRQREVAALIAGGLSNREIADRLVLTPGTVANHVEKILGRLGFSRRTQVAVWAVGRGLAGPEGEPTGP